MPAPDLHRASLVIDGLNASYFQDRPVLERVHQGGVTAVNATVAAWHTMPETITLLADWPSHFAQHADLIRPVRTPDDILAAKSEDRVGVILGFQDTRPLEDNARLVSVYHALGVRIIQLTYNERNRVGCGCLVPDDDGLTEFGRSIISEMNRYGVLVDLSHVGPRTTLEAVGASAQPVAITHANSRTRCPHPRNKTDEAIRAVAARGGVVGAVAFPPLVTGRMDATLDDYLNMIEYLVQLVGVDHVGIGADFMENMPTEMLQKALGGGREGPPPADVVKLFLASATEGFASAAAFPNVTQGLLRRRFSEDDIQKILGLNWLRLYRAVWG